MENRKINISRRSVLRGAGTAALSASFVGPATAESPDDVATADPFRRFASNVTTEVETADHPKLADRYADASAVKAAFRGDVDPILDELAEEGYVESASLGPFNFDAVERDVELSPTDAATGASVTTVEHPEEGASAHLMVTTESADHRVALYRLPELDATYAVVESEDGDGTFLHDKGDDDVATSSYCAWDPKQCMSNSICSTYPTECKQEEAYCCYDDNLNETCQDTRYTCGCSC